MEKPLACYFHYLTNKTHRSNPSPHPTNNVGRVYPEFFRVSTLYRVGGGRTARNFRKGCTVLRGNREMTEKWEYCSTVQRTFVQDCRYVKEVLLVNRKCTAGVPLLSKIAYKRVRSCTLGRSLPE